MQLQSLILPVTLHVQRVMLIFGAVTLSVSEMSMFCHVTHQDISVWYIEMIPSSMVPFNKRSASQLLSWQRAHTVFSMLIFSLHF